LLLVCAKSIELISHDMAMTENRTTSVRDGRMARPPENSENVASDSITFTSFEL
jgi:hypothetical protein